MAGIEDLKNEVPLMFPDEPQSWEVMYKKASPAINKDVLEYIKFSEKPFMEYPGDENYIDAYQDFYEQFIEEQQEAALIEN